MALTETLYKHVILNDKGIPFIAGTTIKVNELVLEYLADQSSPETLQRQHPYLSMGQIHSALAYYWDNKKQMDEEIQKDLEDIEKIKKIMPVPAFASRLKDHFRIDISAI
jgi:uncharacterized protein (DUF433 family)